MLERRYLVKARQRYSQSGYAQKLRVPEGIEFVRADTAEEIRRALDDGLAAFVESCNGRAFAWEADGAYHVDHFFFGPAEMRDFATKEEAVDYASDFCE